MQVVHLLNIFIAIGDLKAWVMGAFLADGADGVAFIVVPWIDKCFIWQGQKLTKNRIILIARIAVLKVCAARPANEQRVA